MIKLDLIRGYLRILRQDHVAVGFFEDPADGAYCAVGALPHHTSEAWAVNAPRSASSVLDDAARRVFRATIFEVNDRKGRDAVLQVYREAILHG